MLQGLPSRPATLQGLPYRVGLTSILTTMCQAAPFLPCSHATDSAFAGRHHCPLKIDHVLEYLKDMGATARDLRAERRALKYDFAMYVNWCEDLDWIDHDQGMLDAHRAAYANYGDPNKRFTWHYCWEC